MATDRREGVRRLIDRKQATGIIITIFVSAASAFVASYLGTQTKTAVLERAVAGVESNVADLKGLIGTLTSTVTNSNLATARETATLQTAVAAQSKDLSDAEAEFREADKSLAEEIRLQNLKLETFGRIVATIQGELNAERKQNNQKE